MNKIIVVSGLSLLLFIFFVAGASYVCIPSPPSKQEIYDQAVAQELECYQSLNSSPERVGECISLRLSRIDKQINLAIWKLQSADDSERVRLLGVCEELRSERQQVLDRGLDIVDVQEEDGIEERMNYALELGGEAFLCTLKHENATFDHTRRHEYSPPIYLCWNDESWAKRQAPDQREYQKKCVNGEAGWAWRKHYDWGFGINDGYHAELFEDDRFFTDWRYQMERAYEIFAKNPHEFHAYTKFCSNL